MLIGLHIVYFPVIQFYKTTRQMCFWVIAAVLFGFFKSTFLGTDESPCSQEEASTSAAVIVSIDFDLHFLCC